MARQSKKRTNTAIKMIERVRCSGRKQVLGQRKQSDGTVVILSDRLAYIGEPINDVPFEPTGKVWAARGFGDADDFCKNEAETLCMKYEGQTPHEISDMTLKKEAVSGEGGGRFYKIFQCRHKRGRAYLGEEVAEDGATVYFDAYDLKHAIDLLGGGSVSLFVDTSCRSNGIVSNGEDLVMILPIAPDIAKRLIDNKNGRLVDSSCEQA